MLKINLARDYYADGRTIFKKPSVEIKTGITVLTGCNGYGKTTLLHTIRDHCNKEKIPYIYFDSIEARETDRSRCTLDGDMRFLATSMCSSEGENITLSIGKFSGRLGSFVRKNRNAETLVILIDALDSGYSIDNITDFKYLMTNTVLPDCKDINLYVIITANSYEMTIDTNCLDPHKCEYLKPFTDYNDYRTYILNTRKIKDKR